MVLVDTSVLIDFLKNKDNEGTKKFNTLLDLNIPFGITGHIYQELLQGTAIEQDYMALKKYLDTFNFYDVLNQKESYAQAAQMYLHCRRKGITIRGSIDCLIMQIAREHRLKLLHHDKDFDAIKKIMTHVEFF